MSFLDDTFVDLGVMGVLPCTASGTNLVTLTGVANTPNVTSYTNLQQFGFKAINSSTGSVTLQVGSLSALPVYAADGTTQLGSGNIVAGAYYVIVFIQSVNGGNGGWVVISASANGIMAGTYTSVTVDVSGRTTAGTRMVPTIVTLFSGATYNTAVNALWLEINMVGGGAGASGSGAGGGNGTNGAVTTFGTSLLTANGGIGGAGGGGGAGGTAIISAPAVGQAFAGATGSGGTQTNDANVSAAGGPGGASPFGGAGGGGVAAGGSAAAPNTGSGGGGSSGSANAINASGGGGAGAAGIIAVVEHYT